VTRPSACAAAYALSTELQEENFVDLVWRELESREGAALRQWLVESFPFVDVYYSNRELPSGSSA
jgi:hypothetical protein